MSREQLKKLAIDTLLIEANAVQTLTKRINENFVDACELLLQCQGRIIVMGMGKSGHIGRKIAATLASTGSPAHFIHPAEANHGDLGMITSQDIILAISNSGETTEILSLLPAFALLGIPVIALSGNKTSTLAKDATVNIDVSVEKEACPLQLAPTASTTATLAMGDALAIALLDAKDFSADDFVRSHPGGALGKRLLLRVEKLMRTGEELPIVKTGTPLAETIDIISEKKLGHAVIIDENNHLLGVLSDGDIRRLFKKGIQTQARLIDEVMSTSCKTVAPTRLATEALRTMETLKITGLPVVDANQVLLGFLHIHDILRAGMVVDQ